MSGSPSEISREEGEGLCAGQGAEVTWPHLVAGQRERERDWERKGRQGETDLQDPGAAASRLLGEGPHVVISNMSQSHTFVQGNIERLGGLAKSNCCDGSEPLALHF